MEIEKIDLATPDLVDENVARIAELFPNVVTEGRDANDKLTRVVDFDALRQELSDSVVEGPQERYRLDWPGKRAAMLAANTPISKTLRPVRDESVDFDTTKNLFIEGDNLDALKLLQETYLGKVKMIYIDPPYNTGKDFIYKDNFTADKQDYLEDSGQVDKDGGRLVANPESNGRYHSDWLSMMYPRLKLARNLLRDDGVIFISIDDHELASLRKLCDFLFGQGNFVANIVWQKKYAATNDAKGFSNLHDHILVYQKSSSFNRYLLPRTLQQNKPYKHNDDDDRGLWRSDNLLVRTFSENSVFPIKNPNTGREYFPPEGSSWRASPKTMKRWLSENRIYFGKDGKGAPQLKRYLSEVQQGRVPNTWWTFEDVGHNDAANKEMKALFNAKSPFDTPKPTTLISQMLRVSTKNTDIVFDFFTGSGTTAHSVMALNAEDGMSRKCISVQLDEEVSKKSEAERTGYKTISDVSKERIRRAGAKILDENPAQVGKLDVGFRVLKIDSSNMNDVYASPQSLDQNDLLSRVEHIKPDRSAEDLLFQVMLSQGVDLSLPIARETLAGKTVFFVGGDALAACFDTKVSEEVVKAMAERRPLYAIFRDDGFASDDMKINAGQLFKQMTDEHTRMKVI